MYRGSAVMKGAVSCCGNTYTRAFLAGPPAGGFDPNIDIACPRTSVRSVLLVAGGHVDIAFKGKVWKQPFGGVVPRYLSSTVADWALENFVVSHSNFSQRLQLSLWDAWRERHEGQCNRITMRCQKPAQVCNSHIRKSAALTALTAKTTAKTISSKRTNMRGEGAGPLVRRIRGRQHARTLEFARVGSLVRSDASTGRWNRRLSFDYRRVPRYPTGDTPLPATSRIGWPATILLAGARRTLSFSLAAMARRAKQLLPLPDQEPPTLVMIQVKLLDGYGLSPLAKRRFSESSLRSSSRCRCGGSRSTTDGIAPRRGRAVVVSA